MAAPGVYAVEGLSREGARGAGMLKADVASSFEGRRDDSGDARDANGGR
jgi:hypothetical protein